MLPTEFTKVLLALGWDEYSLALVLDGMGVHLTLPTLPPTPQLRAEGNGRHGMRASAPINATWLWLLITGQG